MLKNPSQIFDNNNAGSAVKTTHPLIRVGRMHAQVTATGRDIDNSTLTTFELENINKMNEIAALMTKFEQSPNDPEIKQ